MANRFAWRAGEAHSGVLHEDLARLRRRLWGMSSLLTSSVLLLTLAATWAASAWTAREINNATLNNLRQEVPLGKDLLAARSRAASDALDALNDTFDRRESDGSAQGDYLPSVNAPDSIVELATGARMPFTVLVFEDGSMTFSRAPMNVVASGSDADGYLDEKSVASLVERAIEERDEGGRHMEPQAAKLGDMTWRWTTWVVTVNPDYDPELDDGSGENAEVTVYMSGDLEDYAKDGYVAARVFTFADVTPTVNQLERLACMLAVAGVIGSALLALVCRKIIDRALAPVAESQARQREFLIKASHELKTPMASLSSNLDALLANDEETVASQGRWTDNMREDIDELANRTCRLLDLVTQPDGAEESAPSES